jgi:hypothetical protein
VERFFDEIKDEFGFLREEELPAGLNLEELLVMTWTGPRCTQGLSSRAVGSGPASQN